MSKILDRIVEQKLQDIAAAKRAVPHSQLQALIPSAPPVRGFVESLRSHHPMGLIAEVKRASPSAGLIREDFDPVEIATEYAANGAACLSVLTDEHFFQGSLEYLVAVRKSVEIPVLRKDFILDVYQIDEARVAGADAILLIAECLDDETLSRLYEHTHSLGMQALVEIYEPHNLERVLALSPPLIGVNNRNLQTFETRLEHCTDLRKSIPEEILVVGESGIHSHDDVLMLQNSGVHAILVGESLMRQQHVGQAVRTLLGTEN
ncbi:Indole-3-glycerol phosphate synthase [Thalassoglobus neptunius]|uniref:Indole-3-glycerol phosphate synthase n=1 Tax=Thalassoglobus neptunius TaxID=1938619 RepID=A0A5C5X3C7_9PLAN|nr:indole-3-glycerol phosphate synthase TrpC [Thalassoglobus neptunius]TWT56682.1 Indole-3-glycerol phosphate synthase [Thalassoglobus neptunius]